MPPENTTTVTIDKETRVVTTMPVIYAMFVCFGGMILSVAALYYKNDNRVNLLQQVIETDKENNRLRQENNSIRFEQIEHRVDKLESK